MESGTATIPRPPSEEPPAERENTIVRLLRETGDLGAFSIRTLVAAPGAFRYFSEILRQAALFATGTVLFLVLLLFIHGSLCSVFGNYFLSAAGAGDYLGLFTSQCSVRGGIPLMLGYVFAAKLGCGIVAEIGAMRIGEEIDAFESVGIDPIRFVVATRAIAAVLFIPLAFAIAIGVHAAGSYVGAIELVGQISQGSFERVHWGLQSVQDQLFSLMIVTTIGVAIVVVATFYGFRVRGGPAEVGTAVARSMLVNLVLVHVIYGAMASLLWGDDIRLPIGG